MEQKNVKLEFHPLIIDRWDDFEKLFGDRGACGSCWCMWWRLRHKDFEANKGEKNRKAMFELVAGGRIPGILAYDNEIPIGWCSVAPREEFPQLESSKILKQIDKQSVWSIVCLFVAKEYRKDGVSLQLIKAAVRFVKNQGGKIVEGYAIEPKKDTLPDVFAFHGFYSTYLKAGFKEIARRSETRPIMRYII
jgi:GNAT superfamily N-acetyltransferase